MSRGFALLPNLFEVSVCCSRQSADGCQAFVARYNVPRQAGHLEDVSAMPEIDVVSICRRPRLHHTMIKHPAVAGWTWQCFRRSFTAALKAGTLHPPLVRNASRRTGKFVSDGLFFGACFVAVCAGFPHATSAAGCGVVPTEAAVVGYTICTYGPSVVMGQNWFRLDPSTTIITNADGSVTFHGKGESFRGNHNNQQIGTAVPGTNGNFTGTAFGGGAYYEIVASFPTPLHLSGSPDWWLGEIEFWSGNPATQWQGQPAGFNHWMEQDMPGFLTTDHALIGMRDRWGMASGGLTASGFSEVDGPARGLTAPGWPLPSGFNPSLPHKYGYLWVPAIATRKGYMTQFLDHVQLGPTVFWDKYDPKAPPPPVDGSSAYSVQDVRHYFGSFGSNPENPTTLYSFTVWQLSAANDLGPTNP